MNPESLWEDLKRRDEPVSIAQLTAEMVDETHCPCCGKTTDEYTETREEVKEALYQLLGDNKVMTTPDWKYKVPTRFKLSDDE